MAPKELRQQGATLRGELMQLWHPDVLLQLTSRLRLRLGLGRDCLCCCESLGRGFSYCIHPASRSAMVDRDFSRRLDRPSLSLALRTATEDELGSRRALGRVESRGVCL